MNEYRHSVSLDTGKCKGCTHCLRRCPVEAIRIRDGKAHIDAKRCIDCGVCIDVCPHKAKRATCDKLEDIKRFKYKVALPAPSLYGQFDNLDDIDYVLQGLLDMGFDDVYEVSRAAEVISGFTRLYLRQKDVKKPVISSACPVIVRLISMRYPYLCENILPIMPPIDLAAQKAREKAEAAHPELNPEDIGIVFISPCPAKASYVKNNTNGDHVDVDLVLSMSDVYFELIGVMKKKLSPLPISRTGMIGVSWASTGGEASAIFNDKYLAADGIENVMRVLEQLDNGDFPFLEYIELNACPGGCVGGMLTVENPYIAKARLQSLKRYLPVSENWDFRDSEDDCEVPDEFMTDAVEYTPVSLLSDNMSEAMRKMARIQALIEELPGIDCGSCGSPTCACFAEDVVRGLTDINQCVVRMRQKLEEAEKSEKDLKEAYYDGI